MQTWRSLLLFGVSACSLVGAFAQPAQAARTATVVRGSGAGSDKAAALVAHYMRELLARDERYEVVDLNKVLGNPDRDKALRTFATAEEAVQKGHEAYDSLELDTAVELLTGALGKYERQAAYVGDFKKVAEALMLLGATHILRGEEKPGAKRLEQAINVYPQVEPDPRTFNPAMRVQFQETSARLANRAPGTLSLTSGPSYAEVYVDGRFVGVTPLAVEGVTEGRHYVRLEKDGYRPWGKVLEVTSRSETAESATLRTTSRFDDFDGLADSACKRVGQGDLGSGKNDMLESLGVLTNADMLMLAQVRLDGEKVMVNASEFDLASQKTIKSGEHIFAYDTRPETYQREIAVLLRTVFGSNVSVAATNDNKPRFKVPPPKSNNTGEQGPGVSPDDETALRSVNSDQCMLGIRCRTLKIATLATAGGLGLAATGVGIWQWVVARNDHSTWLGERQVAPGLPQLQLSADGRNAALRGDIFFFSGVALVSVGIITYFVWDPTPSVEDVVTPDEPSGGGSKRHSSLVGVGIAPAQGGGMVSAAWQF